MRGSPEILLGMSSRTISPIILIGETIEPAWSWIRSVLYGISVIQVKINRCGNKSEQGFSRDFAATLPGTIGLSGAVRIAVVS